MHPLTTRLTEALGISCPIVSAPMAFAAGGALAAAVTRAGGLGLVGGGYGDAEWLAADAGDSENTAVWFGEAAGLVHAIEPAAAIVRSVCEDAAARIAAAGRQRAGA